VNAISRPPLGYPEKSGSAWPALPQAGVTSMLVDGQGLQ
jgi:hypothetical protein